MTHCIHLPSLAPSRTPPPAPRPAPPPLFSYEDDASAPAGEKVVPCLWNDQTQAEAFAAGIDAWYTAFPTFAHHDLHFIGESYAGLLLPFLVDHLLTKAPTSTAATNLQSLAVGNGCPGLSGSTPDKRGTCNGPYGSYDTQHVFENIAGHAGASRKLHDEIMSKCKFPCKAPTWSEDCRTFDPSCQDALNRFRDSAGDFNMYGYRRVLRVLKLPTTSGP